MLPCRADWIVRRFCTWIVRTAWSSMVSQFFCVWIFRSRRPFLFPLMYYCTSQKRAVDVGWCIGYRQRRANSPDSKKRHKRVEHHLCQETQHKTLANQTPEENACFCFKMTGCHSAYFAKENMSVHKRKIPKAKRSYTIAKKREALDLVAVSSELQAATQLGISRRTIRDCVAQKDKIREFTGSERSPTLKGQGKRELFPFAHGLINYMKDRRRVEKILSTRHMIIYIKSNHADWLANYMTDKASPQSGINALERACQRFCGRYGYTPQKPQSTKKNAETLAATRLEFACKFWEKYSDYKLSEIFNVDETGIDFDMPPKRSWAGRGRRDSAKVLGLNKHSTRLRAVTTARADGKKLPILFIVRAKTGGSIETKELKKYPKGHVYAVQENAWMDTRVWKKYTSELLKYEVDAPSLLLLDNFEAHSSEAGQNAVLEDANARVVPLPPNSTSGCQPLDVGVMGPLKQLMNSLWLIEDNNGDERVPDQRLICINRTIAAWDLLGEEDVKKAFAKAIPRYPTVED